MHSKSFSLKSGWIRRQESLSPSYGQYCRLRTPLKTNLIEKGFRSCMWLLDLSQLWGHCCAIITSSVIKPSCWTLVSLNLSRQCIEEKNSSNMYRERTWSDTLGWSSTLKNLPSCQNLEVGAVGRWRLWIPAPCKLSSSGVRGCFFKLIYFLFSVCV